MYILEDMPGRVSWIREVVDGRCSVLWAADVDTFLGFFENKEESPSLIILDHDLGGIPELLEIGTFDKTGRCGMDAARLLPNDVKCPVIVWSFNSVRAPEMVDALKDRGFEAAWLPFGSTNLRATIYNYLIQLKRKEDDEE